MFERMDPKTLMKWLLVAALVYFVLPYDLIPDFLGAAGRVDDLIVFGWLGWAYRKQIREYFATQSGQEPSGHSSRESDRKDSSGESSSSATFDAYAVLGIPRSASSDAIQAAYRARMKEYHPDKVAHLGEDLQELALEKSQQIQRAYRELHG